MRVTFTVLIAGACALASGCGGCGDDQPGTPDGSIDVDGAVLPDAMEPPDADTGPRTVNGTGDQVHVTTAGETALGIDYASAVVQALVPDDTGSGFSTIVGTGANGSFTIEDVPAGDYYVRINDSYYVTSASAIDLSRYVIGRSSAVEATTVPTNLTLDVDSMPTWDSNDQLSWYDPNSGAYFPAMEGALAALPDDGATSLDTTVDYTEGARPRLVDTSAGDMPVLTQISWENLGGADVDWVGTSIATFQPSSLTMADGQNSTATGSFTAETLDQQLDLDWELSAYLAAVTASHPDATDGGPWFSLQGQAAGSSYGPFGTAYDILTAFAAGTTDISRTFDYGNALGWDVHGVATVDIFVGHALPGRNPIPTRAGYVYSARALSDITTDGMDLVVGPPTGLLIAGSDGTADSDGVGATPTLSWTAPTVGTPSMYRIEVIRLVPQGPMGTRATQVARLWTEDTSITLPPGILTINEYYYVRVVAMQSPNLSIATSPFSFSFPYGEATAISGRFSP